MSTTDEPKKLYRILDFSKLVNIFESKTLYFASPSSWDDPYEKRLKHPHEHAIFSQCWGELGISDAMWRIYSNNGLGVRISTTPKKLREALKSASASKKLRYRLKPVTYKSQANLNKEASIIEIDLKECYSVSRAVDMLYMKRDAFRHESEWRATVFSELNKRPPTTTGISVDVDPHYLIDNILLDPRAPIELIEAFKYYIQYKLAFKGSVRRSVLYNLPRTIQINGDEITTDML